MGLSRPSRGQCPRLLGLKTGRAGTSWSKLESIVDRLRGMTRDEPFHLEILRRILFCCCRCVVADGGRNECSFCRQILCSLVSWDHPFLPWCISTCLSQSVHPQILFEDLPLPERCRSTPTGKKRHLVLLTMNT